MVGAELFETFDKRSYMSTRDFGIYMSLLMSIPDFGIKKYQTVVLVYLQYANFRTRLILFNHRSMMSFLF